MRCLLIVWYILELVGQRHGQQQRREQPERGRCPPRHAYCPAPSTPHITHNTLSLHRTHCSCTPQTMSPKGSLCMSHRDRLGTGGGRCGRAAGRGQNVYRRAAAARRDPARVPPHPAAAVTLRTDHTPNNAAYYLLLRFI